MSDDKSLSAENAAPAPADALAESERPPGAGRLVALSLVFELGLGSLALALGWLLGQPAAGALHYDAWAAAWGVVGTAPLVALLVVLDRVPLGPLRRLQRFVDRNVVPLFADCRWWHMAVLAAAAGVGEELLFRGLVQQALAEAWGEWPAILAAGLVFGLAHPLSRAYVVAATLVGVYLGWLLAATGNLLAPILAHGLYDFVALVYLTRTRRNNAPPHGEAHILGSADSGYTDAD